MWTRKDLKEKAKKAFNEYSGLHVQSVRLKGNRKITDWLVELYQKLWHCKACLRTASGYGLDNTTIPDTW